MLVQNALTILRSNMELESGEVTYEAHLNEPTSNAKLASGVKRMARCSLA